MANGIRTGDPRGFNKGRSSKFREGSRVRQTPEEGRRIYRPKYWGNNNKDEDNIPKTLNHKNLLVFDKNTEDCIIVCKLFILWIFTRSSLAQSVGAVEYTDCFSAEGWDSLNEGPVYDTKHSDGEASLTQEVWGMQSTRSLPSLASPL